jgi:hypothetical protein
LCVCVWGGNLPNSRPREGLVNEKTAVGRVRGGRKGLDHAGSYVTPDVSVNPVTSPL